MKDQSKELISDCHDAIIDCIPEGKFVKAYNMCSECGQPCQAKEAEPTEKKVVDYKLKGHKCKKIAEVDTKLSDRKIWIGELTEKYNEAPLESHCIHIKTPLKEIVLGVNSSDAWWLVAFGQLLLVEDGKKTIKEIQIQCYLSDIKKAKN